MKLERSPVYISYALRVPIRALQLVIMWPINTGIPIIILLERFYMTFTASCLGICSVLLLLKTISTNDLVDRSEAIDIFTLTLSAMYKLLFFAIHHNRLSKLAADTDKLVVPQNWLKYAPVLAGLHCLGGFFAIGFWAACPLLKVIFGDTPLSKMDLPMNIYVWIPFSGWKFCLNYLFCAFGLFSATHVYMAMDGFLFTSIHTANGALRHLTKRLIDLRKIPLREKETEVDARFQELKNCLETHIFIVQYLAKLDLLFRSMILVDVLHAIVSLSFAMLQLSESKGALEWTKMIAFVFYCFLHQYLNSFFGQFLINEQESFQRALEEIPWEESSFPLKTTTLIMMTATSNPIKLSAWRMYFLQYETFAEFVKTMVSTYMVLRQLQDDVQQ